MTKKNIVNKIFKNAGKYFSGISLNIGKNSVYKKEKIISVICQCAFLLYTNEAMAKIGLLRGEKVPSADVVLRRLKQKDWRRTINEFNRIFKKQFTSVRGYFGRREYFDVAIDENRVMRYCKNTKNRRKQEDRKKLVKGKAKNGTHYAHVTTSLSIVGLNHGKFTIAVLPFFKKNKKVTVVKRLIEYAKKIIRIRKAYLDSGFFNGDIITLLEESKIPYIIHASMNNKVKKKLKELKKSKNAYGVWSIQVGKKMANTKLVIVDKKKIKGRLNKNEKRFFAYVTNLQITNESMAYNYSECFRDRWGQETGFRVKDDFLAPTTSLSYNVRIAMIFFAFFLFNIWHYINLKFEKDNEFKTLFHGHIEVYLFKEIVLKNTDIAYWIDKMKN